MKENEIRPADTFQEWLRLSACDAEKMFDHSQRVIIPCPACGEERYEQAFSKHGFLYVECLECQTLYLSPRPPEEEFTEFYLNSESSRYWVDIFFPSVLEARREKIFIPRVTQIRKLCLNNGISPDTVMDIGAGHGIFLEEWGKKLPSSTLCAIEPNNSMADICRAKGIEVLESTAENSSNVWQQKADLATCFEVIEHAHEPLRFIRAIHNLVAPNGMALVTGLGVQGFDIQVLWERSNSISPPHHLNFMSVRGLEILFSRAGFQKVEVTTPGKLDVDIVRNTIANDASPQLNRFVHTMLDSGSKVGNEFQTFLSNNKLSSHCWIAAQRIS
ncbi:MAG: class I SAM-dependent methyltransferase [Magnetococcales bacterium]|nr:class I SAM-dependent methyltransferase [Magnetococcales bacterium]